ncbi:hypothetical protein M5F00_14405 [Acinetobacter sp. ANC 4945]|uniref:hypothetical protein n=1 Tax=Acinetobacter amyesii TaxID=2942470 RepID=UPI00117772EB|nr:hypothetical protein [Acinetobacter amyesii]MCL6249047.1 hypothetical protein [Acinetobacter amyesii]
MIKRNFSLRIGLHKLLTALKLPQSVPFIMCIAAYSNFSSAAVFQPCTASDIQKIKIKSAARPSAKNSAPTEEPAFFDCIYVQNNKFILSLSSHSTGTNQDNAGNYNLTLTLLQPATLKVLNQFQPVKHIIPKTRLDAIKFDRTAFSLQQDLVGIAMYQSHIGGINSSRRVLNLYSIKQQKHIQQVLNGLTTHYQSSTQNTACGEWHTLEMKRTIHFTGKMKNKFPIFNIKEQIKETDFNRQSCRAETVREQNNHQIQFNGAHYSIQHVQLNDPDL